MPHSMEFAEVHHQDLLHGVEIAEANLASPDGQAIVAASAERVRAGDTSAFYVPAVRYIVDATLATLTEPHVEASLSREIVNRSGTAIVLAEYFTDIFSDAGFFSAYYASNSHLRSLPVTPGEFFCVQDVPYLASLSAAPFYDASILTRGAWQKLQGEGVADPKATILRSKGLLAISGIPKKFQDTVRTFIGNPYVKERHLTVITDENGTRVSFTRVARKCLGSLMLEGSGCPAAKIKPDRETSVLESYWAKLAAYLVPEDATADRTMDD